ncbi:response regulator [Phormidium sp. LEGE 05292]|uniref:ATP-binding protein n=1 Tax=[Phormidium] sp. LEGE 05292 TaxID=767427 RepID=UPI00187EFFB5|nr:ATP-binding protein [Phormidium sp. LEGE 05292]MBE9225552.1 response regulator [Phormidium sp. LEGE 05292]
MPSPDVKEFIAFVPSCTQRTTLGKILDIFQQNECDRIVVVSEEDIPLGVLHLYSLLPYLRERKGKKSLDTLSKTAKKLETQEKAVSSRSQGIASQSSLLQPLSKLDSSIITPLTTVPAEFSLQDFWPYLRNVISRLGKTQNLGLVNLAGKFLGLLDIQRLLEFIATDLSTLQLNQESLNLAKVALTNQKNLPNEVAALNSLIQLLEKLPLPLMLQTGNGQSVKQNLAWRQYFDSLQDADWLRKEIAELLEFLPSQEQGKFQHAVHYYTEKTSNCNDNQEERFATPVSLPKLCQLGNNPDSCTCVCPMQNGTERVWQFVKIPLGNVFYNPDLSPKETNLSIDFSQPNEFRLANLISRNMLGEPRDNTTPASPKNLLGNDLWLVLAQDVTESHQVAKELAAKNADLMQLNRLKDEFLACISHELKTPLTAILGLSSLLKDQVLGELNDRQARYTRLIHQSGRHLMTIVNDILDLTRMETGQLELMLAPVDIQAVCDRAYQQSRQIHLSRKSGDLDDLNSNEPETKFILSIEPRLDSLVADEMRLRQMLVHLLSNALKFTEVTGEIGLRVSYWEGWIAFTVWDTGIGIPEDKQHLIFQKFQQLENPLTRQFEGTGLGLVLTQRLARLHGGDVSFTSKPGSGSEFTLLLPPSPPNSHWEIETEEKGEKFSFNGTGINTTTNLSINNISSRLVLVVESIPRLIEDLSQQLSSLGYRIVIARSGTEALEKARRLQPFAIFLNPLLPLLSGWDVLTLLKASPQTQHIPVVVTASRGEKEYAYGKRADGFLSLPVQPDSLKQSLEKITLPAKISQQQSTNTSLTILRLNAGEKNLELRINSINSSPNSDSDLSNLLHQHNYRVLEADDLVQAELLARIWQPHVVLLEGKIVEPESYLEQFIEYQALASLPLVTMDETTTHAALQVGHKQENTTLQVYPCLGVNDALPEANILLQAIQVAAGISCKLTILVVDISTMPDLGRSFTNEHQNQCQGVNDKKRTEWLQALIQYLQTAGLRVVTGQCWAEVLRQAQHCSVDLLLIDLGNSTPNSTLVKALSDLRQVAQRPPTVVLVRQAGKPQTDGTNNSQNSADELSTYHREKTHYQIDFWASTLGDVATSILPSSIAMEDLLNQIRHILLQANSSGSNPQICVNKLVKTYQQTRSSDL